VALLRGINVGKAKRVAMADLRALVEGLGYADVRTLLNSGNVVYTAPGTLRDGSASRIERAILRGLGVTSRVTVLTASELGAIIDANPLVGVADNHSRLLVLVLAEAGLRPRLEPLARQDWSPESLALGERAAYVWMPAGVTDSLLMAAAGKVLRDGVTSRNWATMLKLRALAEGT
jgi:uncharacterized protein (DUF1697 family)